MELERTDGRLKRRQRPKIGHAAAAEFAKEGRFESVIAPSAITLAFRFTHIAYKVREYYFILINASQTSPISSLGLFSSLKSGT